MNFKELNCECFLLHRLHRSFRQRFMIKREGVTSRFSITPSLALFYMTQEAPIIIITAAMVCLHRPAFLAQRLKFVRSPREAVCKLGSSAVELWSHDQEAEGSTPSQASAFRTLLFWCQTPMGWRKVGRYVMHPNRRLCSEDSRAGRAPVMRIPSQRHRICLDITHLCNRSMGYHVSR